jgi:hypothetical protein
VKALYKYKILCAPLVQKFDFFADDLEGIARVWQCLKELWLDVMYPDIGRIIELRRKENKLKALANEGGGLR